MIRSRKELASQVIHTPEGEKTIAISEVEMVLNPDTTDEKEVTRFVVDVNERWETGGATSEPFDTKEEAGAYALEVSQRPLRPFAFSNLLDLR